VAFHFGFDSDLPEAAAGSGIGWLIADVVLVADVVRNLPASFIDFVEGLRKKARPPVR
jgi:hypothetical protein